METVIRLCALCLTGALLAVLLKRTNPDIALLLAVAVCGAALLFLLAVDGEDGDVDVVEQLRVELHRVAAAEEDPT